MAQVALGQSWSLDASAIDSDFYGAHYLDADALVPFVAAAEADGYQLKLHVNGDAAVRAALDAFERHTAQHGPLTQQHVLDHLVLIEDSDYDRSPTSVSSPACNRHMHWSAHLVSRQTIGAMVDSKTPGTWLVSAKKTSPWHWEQTGRFGHR